MTTAFSAKETSEASAFESKVTELCHLYVQKFLSITRPYSLLHLLFYGLLALQFFCFTGFFSFLSKSSLLAFSIGIFFLTIFSYFVLRFYFQAKKPEQFALIKKEFLEEVMGMLNIPKDEPKYYLSVAYAARELASYFQGKEYVYYSSSQEGGAVHTLMQKLSAFLHWEDVHKIRELLFYTCIEMHISLIKMHPIDIEIHASLANAYEGLGKLYKPPIKAPWVPSQYFSSEMLEKFQTIAKQAIEELKIISDYTPADPWSRAKLAALYHELGWRELEIREYETILDLCPQDMEVLYRLGVLYFQQGFTSKGLKIYEKLKKSKFPKADDLLSFYDTYLNANPSLQ